MKWQGKKEFPGDARLHFWWKNPYMSYAEVSLSETERKKRAWSYKFSINFDFGSPNSFMGLSFIIYTPFFFWGLYA
jgi:hypothetical protein